MLNGEVTCYDKRSALQHVALHKPEIRDMQANPLSEGFELKQMIKCKKCQVTYLDWEVDGEDRVTYTYGQKKAHKGIIHGPETLHGNHFGSFVAILVANHDAKHDVKWWRDGSLFAEGDGLYIIWPDQSGTFKASVGKGISAEYVLRNNANTTRKTAATQKRASSDTKPNSQNKRESLPLLGPGDVTYNPATDEIGEGCFGRVYRANMFGTKVALKVCTISQRGVRRGAANIIEGEVKIHALLLHPNIVQLLGCIKFPHAVGPTDLLSITATFLSQSGKIVSNPKRYHDELSGNALEEQIHGIYFTLLLIQTIYKLFFRNLINFPRKHCESYEQFDVYAIHMSVIFLISLIFWSTSKMKLPHRCRYYWGTQYKLGHSYTLPRNF